MNTRADLIASLQAYQPFNEQETRDQELILRSLRCFDNIFTRENTLAHMTASAWVLNPARDLILMAYHRIYQSWSWLGGHADGECDLRAVALREVQEESGIQQVRLISPDIFSLEALTVDGHIKRGRYVSSHLHLNITYLVEADDRILPQIKPDENSAVAWFAPDKAVSASSEPWFREHIYQKLNDKLARL